MPEPPLNAAPVAAEGISGAEKLSVDSAHQAYKQRDFERARALYEALAEKHPESWQLHYNLGNTYFKLQKIGKAVLHYERARRMEPRDYELRSNLNYVQGVIEYKVEDKRNWYLIQWLRLAGWLNFEEAFSLALVLYAFGAGLLAWKWFSRREGKIFRLIPAVLIFFSLSLAPAATKYLEARVFREAVVIAPQVEVRYGPSSADKVAFRLVDGLKVQVEEERGDWFLVRLVNGESGWCEAKDLERI